jgi:UDP-N-acetylglucosamine 1-carboxyvinyltransferase
VTRLSGGDVYATDLRASASLILATLAAEGISHVHNIHHLDRGYDKIDIKLSQLGASILREN